MKPSLLTLEQSLQLPAAGHIRSGEALPAPSMLSNLARSGPLLREAVSLGDLGTLKTMLGPAWRGLIQQIGRASWRDRV